MQFLQLILLCGVASAAAIAPREPEQTGGTYYITKFKAEHIPQSSDAEVQFSLRDSEDPSGTENKCSVQKATKYSNNLGEFTGVDCSPYGTFTLAKFHNGPMDGQYYLEVVVHGADSTGLKPFPKKADQFFETKGGFTWEFLNVPKDFEIKYST